MPGLDGLRAIAVAAVMAYHADPAWLHGGFPVSRCSSSSRLPDHALLIAEFEGQRRVDLRQFWLRAVPATAPGVVRDARSWL
jgi:hypothetical protein